MCRESQDSDEEGEAEQAGDILSSEMGREDHGMLRLHLCFPLLPPHAWAQLIKALGAAGRSLRRTALWAQNGLKTRDRGETSPGGLLGGVSSPVLELDRGC